MGLSGMRSSCLDRVNAGLPVIFQELLDCVPWLHIAKKFLIYLFFGFSSFFQGPPPKGGGSCDSTGKIGGEVLVTLLGGLGVEPHWFPKHNKGVDNEGGWGSYRDRLRPFILLVLGVNEGEIVQKDGPPVG